MSRFSPRLPHGMRRLFRLPANRARLTRDMDAEMRTHLAMRIEHLRARGLSEADANAEALRRFGDTADFREYLERRATRKANRFRVARWLLEWTQDVRFARRQFTKAPTFTAIAVLTLALGIGANTAIFSVIHKLLLAPLPYPHGNRIVLPMQQDPSGPSSVDFPLIQAWQASSRSIEMVASAQQAGLFNVSGDGTVVPNPNAWMTANYLETLGARPVVGRAFTAEEERSRRPTVAMISYGLWQREYGGDASAIGSMIRINQRPYTIVGVAPPGLSVPIASTDVPDMWLPKDFDRLAKGGRVFARLRDGVSPDVATSELQAIAARVPDGGNARAPLRVMRVQDFLDAREVRSVQVLFAAVGVLLLIACANVANLLLARAWTRRREFAIRFALGAGRGRLARQVFTESILLALAGAALGIGVAWATVRGVIALRPPELGHLAAVRVEPVALFWSLAVAVMTGLVFGCAPALVAGAQKIGDVLRRESRAGSPTIVSRRVRSTLIVMEIALSIVLLVGAGLLARSFIELQGVRLGFEPRGLVEVNVMIGGSPGSGRHEAIRATVLDRVRSLPGVTDATLGTFPGAAGPTEDVEAESTSSGPPARASMVTTNMVAAEYFRVARITVVEGRVPDSAAATPEWKAGKVWGSSGEVVVNRALARRLWPAGGAVGSRVRQIPQAGAPTDGTSWSTVVGVVDDVRAPGQRTLVSELRMYALLPPGFPMAPFLMRTATSGEAAIPALQSALRGVDSRVYPWKFRAGEAYVRDGLAPSRFAMMLVGAFAAIAVILAGIGLYGVVAYGVHQRTREIGVRVAFGATPASVAGLVVGDGVRLALLGVGIGTAVAAGTTRVLRGLLYAVSPMDPATFAAIAVLVAAIALLASYIPARRALRIDPTEALRAD